MFLFWMEIFVANSLSYNSLDLLQSSKPTISLTKSRKKNEKDSFMRNLATAFTNPWVITWTLLMRHLFSIYIKIRCESLSGFKVLINWDQLHGTDGDKSVQNGKNTSILLCEGKHLFRCHKRRGDIYDKGHVLYVQQAQCSFTICLIFIRVLRDDRSTV